MDELQRTILKLGQQKNLDVLKNVIEKTETKHVSAAAGYDFSDQLILNLHFFFRI